MVIFDESSNAETALPGEPSLPADDILSAGVLEDKQSRAQGAIIAQACNQGVQALIPSAIFDNLVRNYTSAENIYGQKLLRLLTGESPTQLQRNLRIPEFKKHLKEVLERKIEALTNEGIVTTAGTATEKGITLSGLILFMEEIDHLKGKGLIGERHNPTKDQHGEKQDVRPFKTGDRYRNISIRQSLRSAIRRGHTRLQADDLHAANRAARGKLAIVYCLDASASMKGTKLETAKKAGIALAWKAITRKDEVGLVAFGKEAKETVAPSTDFSLMVQAIARVMPSEQTDFPSAILKATEILPNADTKLIILITDALPTAGDLPEQKTLEAVSAARAAGITISVVGINLDEKGQRIAKEITGIARGRLYVAKDTENLDGILLEEYERAGQ